VARSKTRSRNGDITLPSSAELRRLKLSPEVAWYLLSRGYDLPTTPPRHKTPEPRTARGAAFDPERVDRVIRAFRGLRHTQGGLAGKPLEPDVWQVAYILAPVFGWVRKNSRGVWVRIIRKLYVDVPRKNGKSTISGGLAIYLTAADNEAGAQVFAAASRKDQAKFVFDPIKLLCTRSPALKGHVKPFAEKIVHGRTASFFKVVASEADGLHGGNVHGAIVDELHIHKSPDLLEALESGTGSRDQPLVVTITTADEGKTATVYDQRRRYIENLERRVFADEATYGVIWAASKTADPFAEKTWASANPGYPVSPTPEYMAAQALEAKNDPAKLAGFLRLHLGLRQRQTREFLPLADWTRNRGARVDLAKHKSRPAYGGIDLASVSDLSALCWLIRRGDRHEDGYFAFWRFWTPEENVAELDKSTGGNASLWVEQGWITTTPGDVTDYDAIKAQVQQDAQLLGVQSVGYDPWNATQTAIDLEREGVPMVEVRQGMRTQSPALKECKRLIKKGKAAAPLLEHGDNPVMRWMITNLAVDEDPAGNVKPNKAKSAEKIDGVSALVSAMSEAMLAETFQSAYEERELAVITPDGQHDDVDDFDDDEELI